MNPVHAGPRLTFVHLALTVGSMAAFLWLAAVRATGWGVLAVFVVAEFLLYQSFSRLVVRRKRDLALLRCFGASRGQIFGGVIAEAASVGLLGGIAGSGGGLLLEHQRADFYAFALIVGVGGAVIAGVVPAFKASRVPPGRPS